MKHASKSFLILLLSGFQGSLYAQRTPYAFEAAYPSETVSRFVQENNLVFWAVGLLAIVLVGWLLLAYSVAGDCNKLDKKQSDASAEPARTTQPCTRRASVTRMDTVRQ